MPKTVPDIRISSAPELIETALISTAENSQKSPKSKAKTKSRTPPHIAPDIFYDIEFCPIRSIYANLGGKWSLLILSHLNFGTHRFSELLGAIPDISQRMLTQTLRSLERDGLLIREARATIPPRVDYSVTPLGRNFLTQIEGLLQWSLLNRDEIEGHQHQYDKSQHEKKTKKNTTQSSAA